jgi:hypothetical protein
LRYNGKDLPLSLKEIKNTFSACEKEQTGSGGKYFFCENRGISFSSAFPSDDYTQVTIVKRP